MTWSIRLALLSSLLFRAQIIFCMGPDSTPWESVQLAESFISSFQKAIARSSAFSFSQKDDMFAIRKTVTAAMEKFNSSNTMSKTKFQALNMVFASAVAGITAAEGDANIELKINAIENSLYSAFMEIFGIINTQFVSEIKTLIYTLVHTKIKGESTASAIKVGDYKQGSLRQLGPSSAAEEMKINGSVPQRGFASEQQRPSTLGTSVALNVPSGPQVSSLQTTSEPQTRELPVAYSQGLLGSEPQGLSPQGSSLKTASEQQTRGSPVAYSQGPSGSAQQGLSPQVPSVTDQQAPGIFKTGVATSAATGGGLVPAEQSISRSEVNRLQQPGSGDNKQIGQEAASQEKSGAVSLRAGGEGPKAFTAAVSGSYGVGNVPLGLQGISGIGDRRSGIQETSKTGKQRPYGYGASAAATAAVGKTEPGSNVKEPLEKQSSRVDQRPEAFKPGSYGGSSAASVSEGENNGQTRKDGKGSGDYRSRAATEVEIDSNVTNVGSERYLKEGKDVQSSSRTGNQNEKGIQAHVQSEKILGNQGQYETLYKKAGRFGGQATGFYPPGATSAASVGEYGPSSSIRVSGGGTSSGQRSSDIGGKVLSARKSSETESLLESPKAYGNGVTSTIVTAESGYELGSGVNRLQKLKGQELSSNGPSTNESNNYKSGRATAIATEQGLSSNGSAADGRDNNFESERATAIAAVAEGYGPDGPTKPSNISNPIGSSEVSSVVSSSVSDGSSNKPFAVSNSVTSMLSQTSKANPELSYCNVLIQTLLEIISTLVNLLGSCNIGQLNFGTSNQYSLTTGHSATKDNS